MLLLGIDFETTGLSPEDDRITEIGAVLWNADTNQPIDLINQLVNAHDRPKLSDEIKALTGITEEMLEKNGTNEDNAFNLIEPWVEECDYIVAHNAQFDRGFFEAYLKRVDAPSLGKEWLCTSKDVPYPPHITSRNLRMLGAEHKYINYFPHRAVFDVLAMLYVLSQYDIHDVVELSKEKEYIVRALVSFHEKDKAKDRGYRWEAEKKQWVKIVKERYLKSEIENANFQTRVEEIK